MPRETPILQLRCPGCGSSLEIDPGFAGGVCRCAHCGALLSVPESTPAAARGRPDRPDAPGRSRRPAPGSGATAEIIEQSDGATHRTASGRTIQVPPEAIPTAARRRQIRLTTAVIATGIVAILVVLGVAAILVLTQKRETSADDPARRLADAVRLDGYDADRNPFTLAEQNVLGLPLTGSTVVVVDSSRSSRSWLSLVRAALVQGLGAPGAAVQVVFCNEAETVVYPQSLRPWTSDDAAAFRAAADDVAAMGAADPLNAIDAAIGAGPARLLLILGGHLDRSRQQAIAARLDASAAVACDVLLIGSASPDLARLAETHGGRCVALPADQIRRWQRQQP